jgi:hypothetical protein
VIASSSDSASEIWSKSGRLAVLASATAFVSAFAVNLALSGSAVSPRSPQVVVQRAPAVVAIPEPSVSATVPQPSLNAIAAQPSLSAAAAEPSVLHLEPFVIPAIAPLVPSAAAPTRKKRPEATDESAQTPAKTKVSRSVLRRYGI